MIVVNRSSALRRLGMRRGRMMVFFVVGVGSEEDVVMVLVLTGAVGMDVVPRTQDLGTQADQRGRGQPANHDS